MSDDARIYFHGMPGGPAELTLFGPLAAPPYVAQRRANGRSEADAAYFDRLAESIKARVPNGQVELIGFSLGAVAALQVAARLGDGVSRIDLISAAAPLSTGDYLPQMAGQPVFRLARRSRFGFRTLTVAQSLAMRIAPGLVYNALFATAQGDDAALRNDPAFRSAMCAIVRGSLATSAYVREIEAYVEDWSAILPRVLAPVTLWHGTLDNWSPPDMAEALANALPASQIVRIDGASHFSALKVFLERSDLR